MWSGAPHVKHSLWLFAEFPFLFRPKDSNLGFRRKEGKALLKRNSSPDDINFFGGREVRWMRLQPLRSFVALSCPLINLYECSRRHSGFSSKKDWAYEIAGPLPEVDLIDSISLILCFQRSACWVRPPFLASENNTFMLLIILQVLLTLPSWSSSSKKTLLWWKCSRISSAAKYMVWI